MSIYDVCRDFNLKSYGKSIASGAWTSMTVPLPNLNAKPKSYDIIIGDISYSLFAVSFLLSGSRIDFHVSNTSRS